MLVILAAALSEMGVALTATAVYGAEIPYDTKVNRSKATKQRIGNGSNNSSLTTTNSITTLNGVQNIVNGDTGGTTFSQAAFCKKRHICKISQKQ